MGNSRRRNFFGLDPLHLDPDIVPGRTKGTLGRFDAADPDALAHPGDTPGALGLGDFAEPNFDLFEMLDFESSISSHDFEEMVLEDHVRSSERRRPRARPIPEEELETVEGDHKLVRPFAATCRALLASARSNLQKEKAEFLKLSKADQEAAERKAKSTGEVIVTKVTSIGISSAYRSPEKDMRLWRQYFRDKYYPVTDSERRAFSYWEGGRHGWKAVHFMTKFIRKRKAAPGFSNHSYGIAVDFITIEDGKTLKAETGKSNKGLDQVNQRWEKSWLYKWLVKHKTEYAMDRIPTEAWHWEFHAKPSGPTVEPTQTQTPKPA